MLKREMVNEIADAIAHEEGFYNDTPSLAKRNNNPGNLRHWVGYPVEHGYARFPDVETGWMKLKKQVGLYIDRGFTLRGMMAAYAPEEDGNRPDEYARHIRGRVEVRTGVRLDIDIKLQDVLLLPGAKDGDSITGTVDYDRSWSRDDE